MNEEAVHIKYCIKCGNLGKDMDGNPCECRKTITSVYDAVSCLEIPEQYRGITFAKELLPPDVDSSYGEFLQELYSTIMSGVLPKENYLIASPIGHGKTVFAYACIEQLFRRGYEIFPIYDVLELVNIMTNFDMGRKQAYEVENPERLMQVPLLFVKIPRSSRYEVFDAISMVLDRRVRRDGITIFLFDGTYNYLVGLDRNNILEGLAGNGHYSSVKVKSWSQNRIQPDIEPHGNIG